jgi:hypothetical protein
VGTAEERIVSERTIAIGDVHGCSAALAALVRAIALTTLDTLVFLGDYIDRGPHSRSVLEQVIAATRPTSSSTFWPTRLPVLPDDLPD